jgi:hypothetical protein
MTFGVEEENMHLQQQVQVGWRVACDVDVIGLQLFCALVGFAIDWVWSIANVANDVGRRSFRI